MKLHGWRHKVACHAYNGEGLQRALDGGCDSIEHGLGLTDANIAQMKRQGTWYCPTIAIYYKEWAPEDTPAGIRDRARASEHEQSFKKALQAGVKIVFGTDIGGMSWSEPIAQEFPYMVNLGCRRWTRSARQRVAPAEMLDMPGQIGVIAAGAYADVIAVPRRSAEGHHGAGPREVRDAQRAGVQERMEHPSYNRACT